MSTITPTQTELTVTDLAARVGSVPLWRVRTDPSPGTAVVGDVERIRREEDRICELIDGVFVEKAVSDLTAFLAVELATLLNVVVRPGRLGWVLGADGFVRLLGSRLRAPDVSFVRRDQRDGGRLLSHGYADVAPALAMEIFSPGNAVSELEEKRTEFFAAGTELFWIVYPEQQQIVVSTGPDEHRSFGVDDVLDGGSALPRFLLRVGDLFAAVDLSESPDNGSPSS